MNKGGFLLKLIIITLIVIGVIWWVNTLVSKEGNSNNDGNNQSNNELECVPATCCHPTGCVPKGQEENCAAVQCSAECEPGTLDCNQARCEAINGTCEVVLNSQ